MSNKKQTAVDFAFEKLANQGLLVTRDYKNLVAYREAKEMERQQVIESFDKGTMLWDSETEGWDYYKENYEQ